MDNRQAAQGDLREELLRKQALAEERQELINACLREQEKLKAENDALKAEAKRLQGELAARKRMIENYEAQLLRLHKTSARGMLAALVLRLKRLAKKVLGRK